MLRLTVHLFLLLFFLFHFALLDGIEAYIESSSLGWEPLDEYESSPAAFWVVNNVGWDPVERSIIIVVYTEELLT